jgi:hypothetical protein
MERAWRHSFSSSTHSTSWASGALRSAVDHLLRAFGVPMSLHRDLRSRVFDIAEIALGEFDGGRSDVLLQAMELCGAWNWGSNSRPPKGSRRFRSRPD